MRNNPDFKDVMKYLMCTVLMFQPKKNNSFFNNRSSRQNDRFNEMRQLEDIQALSEFLKTNNKSQTLVDKLFHIVVLEKYIHL